VRRIPLSTRCRALLLLFFAAALPVAVRSQQQTPQGVVVGRRLFRQSCASCHDTLGTAAKSGPKLKNYYRHPAAPRRFCRPQSNTPGQRQDARIRHIQQIADERFDRVSQDTLINGSAARPRPPYLCRIFPVWRANGIAVGRECAVGTAVLLKPRASPQETGKVG
jgi:hypothetical protein